MRCYCCSSLLYADCCEPIVDKHEAASTAEALMRSRFTAYCLQKYQYIVDTYSADERAGLIAEDIAKSAADTRWFALNINETNTAAQTVEFSAFFFEKNKTGKLHETSEFVLENNQWRYRSGTIHNDSGMMKIGRNDPCPCLSNKKFKQCCAQTK
ncbi:YchJ family protein [Salinimonas marina]|uniref:YchJ family protein n=1 Tax=Salinimonas marina TaxID=2785918 RepID=A0A7S9DUY1_9ALTE|nr:YchJ family protein [Salinimonas marina]QPG04453.1 YchJ family protein [Salinimonas marina]